MKSKFLLFISTFISCQLFSLDLLVELNMGQLLVDHVVGSEADNEVDNEEALDLVDNGASLDRDLVDNVVEHDLVASLDCVAVAIDYVVVDVDYSNLDDLDFLANVTLFSFHFF
jgi:hypothetical protein